MKIGDKVRFLSEVGGGIVAGFQDKNTVLVEDQDGFEIPMPINECVVIDTDNYNLKRKTENDNTSVEKKKEEVKRPELVRTLPEVKGGDLLNVYLAYVPHNIREISKTGYDTFLVNDSNYFLYFAYMSGDKDNCQLRAHGLLEPNMKLFLEDFQKDQLNDLEYVTIQLIAFKDKKSFELKPAVSVSLHINTVKFYKLNSFKESNFFADLALIYDVVRSNEPVKQLMVSPQLIQDSINQKIREDISSPKLKNVRKEKEPEFIKIDLHIEQLIDYVGNMSRAEILTYQLDKFREVMTQYKKAIGKKIVFIHGKGNGVLRKEILDELKRKYPKCQVQDASFQEHGFGATQVTIH